MVPNFAQLGAMALLLLSSCFLSDASVAPLIAARVPVLKKLSLEPRGSVPVFLPTGWSYKGCYIDNVGLRVLTGVAVSNPTMSSLACIELCRIANYNFAGTEFGQECYCGTSLGATAVKSLDTDCNMDCAGDNIQTCGGRNRLTLFVSTGPASHTVVPGWTYIGCFADNVFSRTLKARTEVPGGPKAMTITLCLAACKAAGYTLAGVEFAQECYCDNVLEGLTKTAPDGEAQCNMNCLGGPPDICGGPNRLNIYNYTGSIPNWDALGCYTDSITARTLAVRTAVAGNAPMTVELCLGACRNAGFAIAGVEYAQECYCGSTLTNGGVPAPDGSDQCKMACQGNSAEFCGGPNRLNIYTYLATNPNWKAWGCFTDSRDARTLLFRTAVAGNAPMTIELCQAACQSAGYALAGVEFSQECYCANALTSCGIPAPEGNAGCNMVCQGNKAEICGGPNRLNLFSQESGPPALLPPIVPTGWSNQGCWIDNVNARILSFKAPDDPALTISKCTALCAGMGYSIAGMQFSVQCFCDTQLRNGALPASPAECTSKCSGCAGEICGGSSRNSVWSSQKLQPS